MYYWREYLSDDLSCTRAHYITMVVISPPPVPLLRLAAIARKSVEIAIGQEPPASVTAFSITVHDTDAPDSYQRLSAHPNTPTRSTWALRSSCYEIIGPPVKSYS